MSHRRHFYRNQPNPASWQGNNPTKLNVIRDETQKNKHFINPQTEGKMRSIEEIIDEIKREHEEDLKQNGRIQNSESSDKCADTKINE